MSNRTHNNTEFGFSLRKIELIDIQLNHPSKPIPKNTIFNFEVEINHSFNIEKQLVFVLTEVKILIDNELKVGMIKVSCMFSLSEFEKLIKENQKISLPNEIIIALNSVSISTARGILFSELKGTFLHNAILPIVDPTNLKKK